MNTISQLARYLAVITLMVPMLGGALLVAPVAGDVAWRIVRAWNRVTLRIFGVSYEVQFEESPAQLDRGGIIVGLTQQSLLDPTVGFAAWERRAMAIWNIEYALIPFFGWVSFILGWVIVRQSPAQAKRQLEKAADHARNGGLVYLSAEGKRSDDGQLNPYKKGPAVLAIQAQATIHPIYMTGSRACMPPGAWKIRPGHVVIRYLAPIETAGMRYEDRDALVQRLHAVGEEEHARWADQRRAGPRR